MARLENGSYEEIVAHLERELELNALEKSDDLPIATMKSTQTKSGGNLLSSGIDPKTNCTYCKEKRHSYKVCPKLKAKKEREAKDGKKAKAIYPKCPTCQKTNHLGERRWKGVGAHLKPKRNKIEDNTTTEDTNKKEESSDNNLTTSKAPASILENQNPKNCFCHDSESTRWQKSGILFYGTLHQHHTMHTKSTLSAYQLSSGSNRWKLPAVKPKF